MFLTLLAVAAMTMPSEASPAAAAPDSGRFVDGSHTGPAGSRAYKLYLPTGSAAPGALARPLLVVLHGCTQTADDVARGTRFNAMAEAEGLLVLYPEQPAAANPQRCWNWYDAAHQARDAGEPAILAAMVREVMAAHGVDARRVYVAGISAGGAMALTLAATHPELFAAAAVHSAVPYAAATNVGEALAAMRQGGTARPEAVIAAMGERRRSVPLLVIHGAADVVVSPRNAEAIAAQWRELAKPLELRMVEGLGHAWSGGSAEGTYTDPSAPSASEWILSFLRGHAMPVEVRK